MVDGPNIGKRAERKLAVPKFNSKSHWKSYRDPNRKGSSCKHHASFFRGGAVKLQGCIPGKINMEPHWKGKSSSNLTSIFGLFYPWLVFQTPQKWLFYLRKDALPSKSLHLGIFAVKLKRSNTQVFQKSIPKKTSDARFKGKSWVIVESTPRYIPTFSIRFSPAKPFLDPKKNTPQMEKFQKSHDSLPGGSIFIESVGLHIGRFFFLPGCDAILVAKWTFSSWDPRSLRIDTPVKSNIATWKMDPQTLKMVIYFLLKK